MCVLSAFTVYGTGPEVHSSGCVRILIRLYSSSTLHSGPVTASTTAIPVSAVTGPIVVSGRSTVEPHPSSLPFPITSPSSRRRTTSVLPHGSHVGGRGVVGVVKTTVLRCIHDTVPRHPLSTGVSPVFGTGRRDT